MANSYRSQANLQLLLADKALRAAAGSAGPSVGEYDEQFFLESAVFRLRLAYACHIADLLQERQYGGVYDTASDAAQALGEEQGKVPELAELQEREEMPGWLNELFRYRYIKSPDSGSAARFSDMLAVERGDGGPTVAGVGEWLASLQELITRHRDTMFEC